MDEKDAKFDSKTVKATLADLLGTSWEQLRKTITIVEDYPTPSGTGESLDVGGLSAADKLDLGCPEIMKTISIHPTGSVKGCCGHGQLYQKDLAIGNLNRESLDTIIDRGTENIFYWWLHYAGPRNILRRLGVEGDYTSICHACNDLLGAHRGELLTYLEAHRDEIFENDVLLSDHMRRMATWVSTQQHITVGSMHE